MTTTGTVRPLDVLETELDRELTDLYEKTRRLRKFLCDKGTEEKLKELYADRTEDVYDAMYEQLDAMDDYATALEKRLIILTEVRRDATETQS